MKETALVHMEVPAEARHLETSEEIVNLTDSSYDMRTSTFLRWLSLNYIGAATTVGTLVTADPVYLSGAETGAYWLFGIGAAAGIGTAISGIVQAIGSFSDKDIYQNIRDEVAKKAKPISAEEWRESKSMSSYNKSYGIRIRNRSVNNSLVTALLPARMFKKKLVSETVWYEPRTDTFTCESHYMGFAHYTKKIEKFAGRRQTFKTALASL